MSSRRMRVWSSGVLLALLCLLRPGGVQPRDTAIGEARLRQRYQALPVGFEENLGQVSSQVRFVSRRSDYTVYLTSDAAVFVAPDAARRAAVTRMTLLGGNRAAPLTGSGLRPGATNYLDDIAPRKSVTNIRTFAEVRQRDVYPGIDLVYHGDRQLEYDFVVNPGATPEAITLRFDAEAVQIDEAGDLIVTTAGRQMRHRKPLVYQHAGGTRREIAGRYTLHAGRDVGFSVAEYDTRRTLIIDPVLEYSTYLNGTTSPPSGPPGSAVATGFKIVVDASGNAYVMGDARALDFPTTDPPGSPRAGTFVAKMNAEGSALVYSTFLPYDLLGDSLAVGADGSAYFAGRDTNVTPWNARVLRINPQGNGLLYATTIPRVDSRVPDAGIAVDGLGNAYFAAGTTAPDFATVNPLKPALTGLSDAVIVKLDPAGSVVYSTYFGGSASDDATGIAVDAHGVLYLAGRTTSPDLATPNAAQSTPGGLDDCWVAKVDIDRGAIEYATYWGGSDYELTCRLGIDPAGNAYLTGTAYSLDVPLVRALQSTRRGPSDAFVAKFNPAGAFIYSTLLGGAGEEAGYGVAADAAGHAYVTGFTSSADFPTAAAIQPALGGGRDGFVTKLSASGARLLYSTYLGGGLADVGFATDYGFGIAVDAHDGVYVTGNTDSLDFPTANALQPQRNGRVDAFITKIRDVCPPDVTTGLNIYTSPFVPFLVPELQLQLVLIQNNTAGSIGGPLAFVPENTQGGVLLSPTDYTTACVGGVVRPFAIVHAGADETLSPQEITGAFVFFYKPAADPIVYVPRFLSGIPTK